MSAFLCDDKFLVKLAAHIQWGADHGMEDHYKSEFLDLAGELRDYGPKDSFDFGHISWGLFAFNADSVAQRYQDEPDEMAIPLKKDAGLFVRKLDWLWFYDALRCWTYQSCEGEQMGKRPYEIAEKLISLVAFHLVDKMRTKPVKWGKI